MKDVITSFFILAAMCGLFVFNSFIVGDCSDKVSGKMRLVSTCLEQGDGEAAQTAFESASDEWERQKKKILYICHHTQIEQIDRAIFASGRHMQQGEYADALFKAAEARFLIDDLSKHEKITLDNIF